MSTMNIQFSPPDITELEINEVVDAMKSGWITTGPRTKLFEKKIAEYCGVPKAVCLNSATACLELILRRLGIGPGDEVITCAYTYTASASVIDHVGAKIVFVDVEPGTYHIDYTALADAITEKTKAVIPVDIGGVMVDYDKVFEAVESKKDLFKPSDNDLQQLFGRVVVVSDSAHSFGAVYHGLKAGAVADFSSFSFHAVKNLTTAEGGAVVWKSHPGLDDEELYHWFMLYSLHGQSKDALAKMKLGAWEYDIVYPAYKCNMTDITAAMGIVQLQRFDGLSARRKWIIREYDKVLLPLGIERLEHFGGSEFEGNGHLYLLRVPGISEAERNEIIVKMAEAGIATNVHFKPLPMHTAYKNLGFDIKDYPWSYRQYKNEITLPLHTLLKDEEVDYIAETLKTILQGREPHKITRDEIIIDRIWDSDYEGIRTVQEIIKDCGEEMFIRQKLLHWATPLSASLIKEECLTKEVYLIKDAVTGKAIATGNVTDKPSLYFDIDRKALYMQRLAVSPELWRHGIGRAIFNAALEKAKREGYECIRSTVYSESPAAVAFLEAMGFKTLYKRPSKNFILLCMERDV